MKRVLASGLAPKPPPAFKAADYADCVFDPPLKKERPPKVRKVLKSGRPPEPPPEYVPKYSGEFNPPLKLAQPKAVFKSVPKVLASGLKPQPPPVFDLAGVASGEFDPPISTEPAK